MTASRFIAVRLRPSTFATVERIGAACWLSPAELCAGVVAAFLESSVPNEAQRIPMPPGKDLFVVVPLQVWRDAKRISDRLDITIGQLARLAIETWATNARAYERRLAC